eukprot:6125889-Alexandrium_andersonii.AAC.1
MDAVANRERLTTPANWLRIMQQVTHFRLRRDSLRKARNLVWDVFAPFQRRSEGQEKMLRAHLWVFQQRNRTMGYERVKSQAHWEEDAEGRPLQE